MKTIIGNFQIELDSSGDLIIGKDIDKLLTIKNDGSLEVQNTAGTWGQIKNRKIVFKTSGESYASSDYEMYLRGQQMKIAGKNSDVESVWFVIDFDSKTTFFETSET